VVINPDNTMTYTPDPNFTGTDTFDYTACDDGTPALCDTATVTVTVGGVNDPPVANDDAAVTDEDTPVVIDVVANDTDPDGNLDPASVSVTGGPFNGQATANGDGTVTYTPNPDFNGTDSFSYEVCDDTNLCDTATVTVTVGAVPEPSIQADMSVSKTDSPSRVPTGRNLTYTVTVANGGPDAGTSVLVTDQLPPSVTFVSASPSQGTYSKSGGTILWEPGEIGSGASATLEIVVTPGIAGTITNTVEVSTTASDPNPGNNMDVEDTSVCRITSRRSSIPCG
jgi:uncharacterized repeat protein (TIGR01451 family)